MTLSGLGGAQECGCATSWRVQTKAVAACVLGKTASGDAAVTRPTWDSGLGLTKGKSGYPVRASRLNGALRFAFAVSNAFRRPIWRTC